MGGVVDELSNKNAAPKAPRFCYNTHMKHLLVAILFLAAAPLALAFNIQELSPERPYDPLGIEYDQDQQMVLLGSLDQFPLMYEMKVEREIELRLQLRQSIRASSMPVPFSLIVVKQEIEGRGVTEIGRMSSEPVNWTSVKDKNFGMTFRESEVFTALIEPGVYNIEVSTPENIGKYMLLVGNQELGVSYGQTLSNIRTTQKFFGYSIFSMLLVPQVYYPLGVLILLFGIHRTWKLRKNISHVA